MTSQKYTFYTDSVSVKSYTDEEGQKQHIIEGYISTSALDRVNDIVTKECLEDMAAQIKSGNIKLDVEHEAWTKSPNIVPIGKIIDAKVTPKGLWVKAIINSHSSRFKEIWMSIKSGFIDAFSIAYKVKKHVEKKMGEATVRLLDQVELLNVALTGNPANPECRIDAVMMKSLRETEETTMAEETPEVKSEEQVVEQEPAPEAETKSEVTNLAEEVAALKEELKSLKENRESEVAELKSSNEESSKLVAELKARLDAAEEAMSKPQLKTEVAKDNAPKPEAEVPKNPLSMIR